MIKMVCGGTTLMSSMTHVRCQSKRTQRCNGMKRELNIGFFHGFVLLKRATHLLRFKAVTLERSSAEQGVEKLLRVLLGVDLRGNQRHATPSELVIVFEPRQKVAESFYSKSFPIDCTGERK